MKRKSDRPSDKSRPLVATGRAFWPLFQRAGRVHAATLMPEWRCRSGGRESHAADRMGTPSLPPVTLFRGGLHGNAGTPAGRRSAAPSFVSRPGVGSLSPARTHSDNPPLSPFPPTILIEAIGLSFPHINGKCGSSAPPAAHRLPFSSANHQRDRGSSPTDHSGDHNGGFPGDVRMELPVPESWGDWCLFERD
jgi:hypothetical protein